MAALKEAAAGLLVGPGVIGDRYAVAVSLGEEKAAMSVAEARTISELLLAAADLAETQNKLVSAE